MILQQHCVCARCVIIDGVIRAHHRFHMTIHHGLPERREIRFLEVTGGYDCVKSVPLRFRPGMYSKVLACCDCCWVVWIRSLDAFNKGRT